jgi:hypothetical protein
VDPIENHIIYYSMQHGNAVRLDSKKDSVASIIPSLPNDSKDTLRFNYITPYFISPFDRKTLYHGGNFVFKSLDRGDSWKVISPDLSLSANPLKKSFALGALVESKLEKGLLYAGTDKGAFWVSKDSGKLWEEHSTGIADNYIRSISPSRFSKSRVYMAMTGLNYDDLKAYLYVSEDFGANWKMISAGLPNEPINVILEDPKFENILYAGTIRGVFTSVDKGTTWSYLGKGMPMAAIADIEINESTMELVLATHGRGIYKLNLNPMYQKQMLSVNGQDYLFPIPEAQLPWTNSLGGETDYRTVQKLPITFWLNQNQTVNLSIADEKGAEVWGAALEGKTGFNQLRWDLIVERATSGYAYFIHFDKFLSEGTYQVILTTKNESLTQPLVAKKVDSPYIQ